MMSFDVEEKGSFDHMLLMVRKVSVYKILPCASSGSYKCDEWLQSDKISSAHICLVSRRYRCEIHPEDPSFGDLFGSSFIYPGQCDAIIEPCLDSLRYFVLKIKDGGGKHAFIRLGFNKRNEAFHFNVELSDHDKYVKREHEKEAAGGKLEFRGFSLLPVLFTGEKISNGMGRTRRDADQQATENALHCLAAKPC